MVDIIDSTRTVSIARTIIEGNLQIVNVTAPSEVAPGTSFNIELGLRNDGGDDTGFIWVFDTDTGEYLLKNGKLSIPGYASFPLTLTGFVMPNREWNLRIEAGHVE